MNNAALRIKQCLQALSSLSSRRRSSLFSLGTILLVTGLLVFSIRKDWRTILTYPWQLRLDNVVIMMVLHSLALGAMFLAWRFTMHRLSVHRSWRLDFRIFSLSMLARRVPIPIWYVGSRLYLYQEEKVSKIAVLAATAFETFLVGLGGLICYVLLLPWYSYSQGWPWQIPFGLILVVSAALLAYPGLLVDLMNLVLRWRKRLPIESSVTRKDLALWLLLYLATWFIDGLGLFFTVRAFIPLQIPAASLIGVSTVTALVGMATMALPSGFGLKEITMGALLSAWMPLSAGVILSVVYRLLQTLTEVFWSAVSQWGSPA